MIAWLGAVAVLAFAAPLDVHTSATGFALGLPLSPSALAQAETHLKQDGASLFFADVTGPAGEQTLDEGPIAAVAARPTAHGLAITLTPRPGFNLLGQLALLSDPIPHIRVGTPVALAAAAAAAAAAPEPSAAPTFAAALAADAAPSRPRRLPRNPPRSRHAEGSEKISARPAARMPAASTAAPPARLPAASQTPAQAPAAAAVAAPQAPGSAFGWAPPAVAGTSMASKLTDGASRTSTARQLWPALAVFVALLMPALWWLQRRRRRLPLTGGHIEVLAARSLGGRHKLAVVQVDGERLLLAIGDHEVSLLSHLAADPKMQTPAPRRFELNRSAAAPLAASAPVAAGAAEELPVPEPRPFAAALDDSDGDPTQLSALSSDVQGLLHLKHARGAPSVASGQPLAGSGRA